METLKKLSGDYGSQKTVNNSRYSNVVYMEKIRSGQTFLYRKDGSPGMVLEVRMKDHVCGKSLKWALDRSLLRYPYLTGRIVEKNGEFYLVKNSLPFILEETSELHSLGSAKINYHLIDISYKNKIIYISYHHGLCDGKGIMPFVKTLIYYYCTLKYNRMFNVPDVRLVDEPLLKGETAEPLGESLELKEKQIPQIYKDGFALPDSINSVGQNKFYRYEVKIRQDNFIKFSKANNATPAITIALLASKAIKKIYTDTDKPIVCNLASDLRKGIRMDNTFKNCVGSISLPYLDEFENLPFREQAAAYRKMIEEYKKEDNLKREINKQVYLYDKLDELHSLKEKKGMLSFFNNLISNTFILSYVGQTKLGDCEKYIDSFHTYTSGTNGLSLQMLAIGEYITVNFMQSFETDKYINAFAQTLEEAGFKFTVSDIIENIVPSDSIEDNSGTRNF